MTEVVVLAAAFDAARPRLVRLAYAVLGSNAEAEDVVSDCWERLVRADARDTVHDVEGWAVIAVSRRALDVLRSARVRREAYVGPWLPEPVLVDERDPADRVTLDETVSFALMVVLETLSPAERTAFVLHDVFGMTFDEVATVVGRSPAAVRQLASRARRHVQDGSPRLDVGRGEHESVVWAFAAAAEAGDLAALVRVLDPDVVLTSDGGGLVSAARRPVLGADRVARFVLGILAKAQPGDEAVPLLVNGDRGLGFVRGGVLDAVLAFAVVDGRVVRVDLVRSPEKLPRLPA